MDEIMSEVMAWGVGFSELGVRVYLLGDMEVELPQVETILIFVGEPPSPTN